MIAADASTLIAYLTGESGLNVHILDHALVDRQICLPPVVLTELLSDPKLTERLSVLLHQLPLLHTTEGYLQRAGALRASVLARRRNAPLADTLIAQTCLDYEFPLLMRDLQLLP